jgi:DNA-binding winged helix-turn-helix (wHTH) protein/tetratricopeptide (TPR) repeat protein
MPPTTRQRLVFQPFHLSSEIDLLYEGDEVVPLEPQAVRVLRYLVEHHDRVVSKDELLEHAWPNVFTTDGVLKKAISQARRALGDDADAAKFIATYHGRGYRFIAPVQRSAISGSLEHQSASVETTAAAAVRREPFANDPDYDQLVGREAELDVLLAEYRRTLEGTGRPVLILGEPGIGKTLLARHFEKAVVEQDAQCLYARFFDYRASRLAPYEIFLDFLRTALGLDEANEAGQSESLADLRATVEQRWGIELPEELFIEGGETTGPARVRGSTGAFARDNFRAVVPLSRCFLRLSKERPLIMVFDDLQWADSASRDLIGYLMRTIEGEPLMIVGLVRRGGTIDPQHPLAEWMRLQANYRSYTSLTLKPLSEGASREAIDAIFGGSSIAPEIPPQDFRTLYRMTGGNPYFLTEILRLLVAEGAIAYGGAPRPRWHWYGMKDLRLPETIVMAAQNKFDRLSPGVREIVEQAAVIGDEFRVETLALMAQRDESEIAQLLNEAVRKGVLSDRALSAGEDCRFHHTTLRSVLYNSLAPRARRELHARAARALARVYAYDGDRIAVSLSNHYEVAGELEQTITWSMRAWQAARARWNWNEAVGCLERAHRALESLEARGDAPVQSAERLTLLIGLGEGYATVGRMREAEQVLDRALLLAESLEQKTAKGSVLLQQGQIRIGLGLYREANELTRHALQIYEESADSEGQVLARIQLGAGEVAMGDYAGIAPLVEMLEAEAPASAIAVIAWGLVGWGHALQGRYEEGIAALERALSAQERTGDLRQRALLERRLGWAHLSQGRFELAFKIISEARADFRSVGDLPGEAKANMELGLARISQGLYAEGLEHLGRTLDALRLSGDAHCEAEALWALGRAHNEAGRLSQAETLLQRSLEMLRVIGDRDDELRVLVELSRLRFSEADFAAAERTSSLALDVAEHLHTSDGIGLSLVERARARFALGRVDEARADCEKAVELLEATGSGELWRAYWAMGLILEGSAEEADVMGWLRKSVLFLERIREQLEPSETSRRTLLTRARSGPARDLVRLLGRTDVRGASEVGREWLLDRLDEIPAASS